MLEANPDKLGSCQICARIRDAVLRHGGRGQSGTHDFVICVDNYFKIWVCCKCAAAILESCDLGVALDRLNLSFQGEDSSRVCRVVERLSVTQIWAGLVCSWVCDIRRLMMNDPSNIILVCSVGAQKAQLTHERGRDLSIRQVVISTDFWRMKSKKGEFLVKAESMREQIFAGRLQFQPVRHSPSGVRANRLC